MSNNNALLKYNTVYSSKLVRKKSDIKTFFKVIFCWTIPIAYLVHYRDKQKESNETIKALQGEIQRLDLTIENQARTRRQKNNKPELIAEQTKRLVKNGNNVRLEETKTCDGDYRLLNEFMSSGGW